MKTTTQSNKIMNAPTDDVYGFFGVIIRNENLTSDEAQKAWECAMETITEVAGGQPILARNFLRSRFGRHFADLTSFHQGPLAERIRKSSGEKWVRGKLHLLHAEGFHRALFEGDPAA